MTFRQQHKREFDSWRAARHRCSSPNSQAWPNYGGRGIRMCERWAASFESFFEDMGPCPANFTLDRIDNDRGYEPGNCRWTSAAEQGRNTRLTMTWRDARCVKLLLWQGFSTRIIADSMGLTINAVIRIRNGETWNTR